MLKTNSVTVTITAKYNVLKVSIQPYIAIQQSLYKPTVLNGNKSNEIWYVVVTVIYTL